MSNFALFLSLALLLPSCSGSLLNGNVEKAQGGSATGSNEPLAKEQIPSTDIPADTSEVVPTVVELNPTPAITPTIIAGATLTCVPSSSNSILRCESKVDGILSSAKPSSVYMITGAASTWTSLPFADKGTGVIEAVISSPPASYGVAVKLTDSQFVLTTVGIQPLEFVNVTDDPLFKKVSAKLGNESAAGRQAAQSTLIGLGSSWVVSSSDLNPCAAGEPYFQINFDPLAPPDSFYASLETRCADASKSGNISLAQKIVGKPGHIYRMSFIARAATANSNQGTVLLASLLGLGWGAELRSPTWIQRSEYVSWNIPGSESELKFTERGLADGNSTFIQNIQLLDFGAPPSS